MKYRIIILIIIMRLGEILLSYMANTSHTHARTHPVSMYFPSQHFMILLVDDVVSSRRPITPEIHLLSLTIFTQERERHFIYCRCLQTVTLAIGYYNRHIHYIHSGDG